MLWAFFRERFFAARIRRENLLKDLYVLGERSGRLGEYVPITALMGERGQSARTIFRSARPLVARGLIERSGDGLRPTDEGMREAEQVVRKHRLWEVYLTRRLDLPSDHVHRDAEAMEHALSESDVNEFEERLGFPAVDPHGRPIPPRRKGP